MLTPTSSRAPELPAWSAKLVNRVDDREPAVVVDRHALDGEGGTDRDALDLASTEEHDRYAAGLVDQRVLEARAAAERLDAHGLDPPVHGHALTASHLADRGGACGPDDRPGSR